MKSHLDVSHAENGEQVDLGLCVAQEYEGAYWAGVNAGHMGNYECPYSLRGHTEKHAVAWLMGYVSVGGDYAKVKRPWNSCEESWTPAVVAQVVQAHIDQGFDPKNAVKTYYATKVQEEPVPTYTSLVQSARIIKERRFSKELANLLNKHGKDTELAMSDSHLADHLVRHMTELQLLVNPPKYGEDPETSTADQRTFSEKHPGAVPCAVEQHGCFQVQITPLNT